MLRRRESLSTWAGLCVRLAMTLLGIAAILFFTKLASARQISTIREFSAPAWTEAGAFYFEPDVDRMNEAGFREIFPWANVSNQEQEELDPAHITMLGSPTTGAQQAIVMPTSDFASGDDRWFVPSYARNDPDRPF